MRVSPAGNVAEGERRRRSAFAWQAKPLSARAGDASDLGDRRETAADLLEPVLAQPHHALVDGRVGDRLGGLAGDGQGADRVRHPHDLVEADPALVPGAAAAGAADGLVGLEVEADVEAVEAHDVGGDRGTALALLAQEAG